MATQPFRTSRPAGSPSSGGSTHTLGAHLANNAPHPQFVKKGDAVGSGNLTGHEADPNAHLRFYLSRNELGSTISDFNNTVNRSVNISSNYAVGANGPYVVTAPMLSAVLGNKSALVGYFKNVLNKWDVALDVDGSTLPDELTVQNNKVSVVALSLFKKLYDVVGSMFFGVSGIPNDHIFSGKNGSNVASNPLTSIYSVRGHTHSIYDVVDPNDPSIHAALSNHTHSGYAAYNHTHPQYVTFADLEESDLSKRDLRDVGIFEGSVLYPESVTEEGYVKNYIPGIGSIEDASGDDIVHGYNLNRYTVQGNWTFALNCNMFNSAITNSVLEKCNFPEDIVDAIKKQADSSTRTIDTSDIDPVNLVSILSVNSVTDKLVVFGSSVLTDYLSTGVASKTYKFVQQMLSTDYPVKSNEYSGTDTTRVEKYKSSTRKIYNRNGYSLETAWYITSVVRELLGETPKSFFEGTPSQSAQEYIASKFNSAVESEDAVGGCQVGYLDYPYFSASTKKRLRLPPEFLGLAETVGNVKSFARNDSVGASGNGSYLTRDRSGWLIPGYYKHEYDDDSQLASKSVSAITDMMECVLPVNTGVYIPYLEYYLDKSRYPSIDRNLTAVDPETDYYYGEIDSASLITNKYSTSLTVDKGDATAYAGGSGSTAKTVDGLIEVAPPACIKTGESSPVAFDAGDSDPYLYELVRVSTSTVSWSNPNRPNYSPVYRLKSTTTGSNSGAYEFVELRPADGFVGENLFVQESTFDTNYPSKSSMKTDDDGKRLFSWDSTRNVFVRLTTDQLDMYDAGTLEFDPYIYTGSSVDIPDIACVYSKRYVYDVSYSSTSDSTPSASKLYYLKNPDGITYSLAGTNGTVSTFESGYTYYEQTKRLQWNKILISERPQYETSIGIDPTENVYIYDTESHKFFTYGEPGKIYPVEAIVDGDTVTRKFPLYRDPVIRTIAPSKEKISPHDGQYVLPKIKTNTRAKKGVTYVKFENTCVEYFNSGLDPDYTTGFDKANPLIQTSFVVIEDADEKAQLTQEKGYPIKEPSCYKKVFAVDPVPFAKESRDLVYIDNKQYFTLNGGEYVAVDDPQALFDNSTGRILDESDALNLFVINANTEDANYIPTGTLLEPAVTKDGQTCYQYGVWLPRYDKHLDESGATKVYIKSLFFVTTDKTPVAYKHYYTSNDGYFSEIASSALSSTFADESIIVYEAIALEDLFDVWCAIKQLTTVGATIDFSPVSGSDPFVYDFDVNGDLITWDDWQELVTHGDPSFAEFESRTEEFKTLADTMLPWLNAVKPVIDAKLKAYDFKTGTGASAVPNYVSGFDAVFKHAKWFASLTNNTASTLCGIGTATNISVTDPTVSYSGTGTGITGSLIAPAAETKTSRLTWKRSSTNVPLANFEDLAKYARGDWVYALQERLNTLENTITLSYFETLDSVPVIGRIYYTKSGSNYIEAGRGGVDGFTFSIGVTYYECSNLTIRLEELEHIWEWFENMVQSGNGSLVIDKTSSDVCIDAFLMYDSSGNEITRGETIRLCGFDNSLGEAVHVKVPTAKIATNLTEYTSGKVLVDYNISGSVVGSNTKVAIMNIDEGDYDPYEFSIVLKCDDSTYKQNKEIENPVAEILIPKAGTSPAQYQGAMYVPANSLLWVVKTGANHGVYFRVPQSWVDLYDLGSSNSTYHIYLRKKYYANTSTPGLSRANRILVHKASS